MFKQYHRSGWAVLIRRLARRPGGQFYRGARQARSNGHAVMESRPPTPTPKRRRENGGKLKLPRKSEDMIELHGLLEKKIH